ncbi:MAG: universal stress protein [Thermoplasmatota archaeon]
MVGSPHPPEPTWFRDTDEVQRLLAALDRLTLSVSPLEAPRSWAKVDVPTIRRILVATDGSEHSAHAVQWAREASEAFDAAVFVLHILEPSAPPMAGMAGGTVGFEPLLPPQAFIPDPTRRANAERIVREAADALAPRVAESIVAEGWPESEISGAAARLSADLVVLGRPSFSGLAGVILGNVTDPVEHRVASHVLLAHGSPPAAGSILGIMGPREVDQNAVLLAHAMARALQADLELLYVSEDPRAAADLEATAARLNDEAPLAGLRFRARTGPFVQEVEAEVHEARPALVVTGAKDHRHLADRLGSHSVALFHRLPSNILLVRGSPAVSTKPESTLQGGS